MNSVGARKLLRMSRHGEYTTGIDDGMPLRVHFEGQSVAGARENSNMSSRATEGAFESFDSLQVAILVVGVICIALVVWVRSWKISKRRYPMKRIVYATPRANAMAQMPSEVIISPPVTGHPNLWQQAS